MSQTNIPTIHAGIDVAKKTLDVRIGSVQRNTDNNARGHARILKLVEKAGGPVHVILEASGGYEAPIVRALHSAGVRLSVVQPKRVRSYAEAAGVIAKTDRIDAQMLAEFGRTMTPAPTQPATAYQLRMEELSTRRAQLIETRTAELNRAAHYELKTLERQSRQFLAMLNKQIAECERLLAEHIAAEPAMQSRCDRLQQVSGVGQTTAVNLLAYMPELGTLSDESAAALAGVAPYNHDSGPYKGLRRIYGGRAPVRCSLYMAALSAVRHDRILREFYQRLRKAGKLAKVALTAVMRKLIILLNRMLKNPAFALAS